MTTSNSQTLALHRIADYLGGQYFVLMSQDSVHESWTPYAEHSFMKHHGQSSFKYFRLDYWLINLGQLGVEHMEEHMKHLQHFRANQLLSANGVILPYR